MHLQQAEASKAVNEFVGRMKKISSNFRNVYIYIYIYIYIYTGQEPYLEFTSSWDLELDDGWLLLLDSCEHKWSAPHSSSSPGANTIHSFPELVLLLRICNILSSYKLSL